MFKNILSFLKQKILITNLILILFLFILSFYFLGNYGIKNYFEQFKQSSILRAKQIVKTYRNDILADNFRDLISKFKSDKEIKQILILNKGCIDKITLTKVHGCQNKYYQAIESRDSQYLDITLPVYFDSKLQNINSIIQFKFTTSLIYSKINHYWKLFTILSFSILILILLTYKINLSLFRRSISEILIYLKNSVSSKKSNDRNRLIRSVPQEIAPLVYQSEELLKVIKEYQIKLAEQSRLAAIGQTTSMLAHDVRKPFTAIKMFLAEFPKRKNDESFINLMTSTVDRSMNQVNSMIEDTLEMTRNKPPEQEMCNPQSLINASLRDTFRSYDNLDIEISYDFKSSYYLNIDLMKMQRVFVNIIGNAIEAMEKKGRIWFETKDVSSKLKAESSKEEIQSKKEKGKSEETEDQRLKTKDKRQNTIAIEAERFIEITIGNSGSYIPKDDQEKLFDAFYTKGKKKGTGLGLAICKRIIESHGGCISVESDQERGTEFIMTLPSLRGDLVFDKDYAIFHSSDIMYTIEEKKKEQNIVPYIQKIKDLYSNLNHPLKILVVDDEPLFRVSIRSLVNRIAELKDLIHIMEVESGEKALLIMEKTRFDFIITDIDMGKDNIDGYEFTETLLKQYPGKPVLILSNRVGTDNIDKARKLGAYGFFSKPISEIEFSKFLSCSKFEKNNLQDTNGINNKKNSKLKVIVVDDEKYIRDGYCEILKEYLDNKIEYEIKSYEDGESALESIKAGDINLIFSDINMGKMNGFRFTENAKKVSPSTKIFLVSNELASIVEEMAEECGADGYIEAPLRVNMVEKIIGEIVNYKL